ncbi:MAG: hypothetical protein JWR47_3662 [Phenylobacterium sp.]|jgi:hypothetical protein|nr:hypothetical protein [Phenylobacterium sp.]MDB5437405.1 hypothetical protein [Phenylobacterium sp.]MDB5465163.1 hypothetical protein [Phenylobacterium sp.]
MSVAAISGPTLPPPVTPIRPVTPAPTQAAKTDNDGDSDNGAPDVRASTPPGVGENLDIKV